MIVSGPKGRLAPSSGRIAVAEAPDPLSTADPNVRPAERKVTFPTGVLDAETKAVTCTVEVAVMDEELVSSIMVVFTGGGTLAHFVTRL